MPTESSPTESSPTESSPTESSPTGALPPEALASQPEDDEVPTQGAEVDPDEEFERDIPDKLYFRIGEVAELVGVEPHVLRYWEGEFRMRPHRSNSGQRLYRRKDIARFLRIRRLLHVEGFTIAGARKALVGGKEGAPAAPTGAPGPAGSGQLRDVAARLAALRADVRAFRADCMLGLDALLEVR